MRRSEIRCVATVDLRHATETKRLDIVTHQGARLRAVVDKERKFSAARNRLDAERAGAGKQVEHAGIRNRIVVGVNQDVEERLAQTIRCGTNVTRGRRGEIAALQPAADDAHSLFVPRLEIALAMI